MLSLFDENYNDVDHLSIYIYIFPHSYVPFCTHITLHMYDYIILFKVIIILASIMTFDIWILVNLRL